MLMKPYTFILKNNEKKQAYKETMNIYIDDINTFEIGKKVKTIIWRPIYAVIEEAYFKESENFQMIL